MKTLNTKCSVNARNSGLAHMSYCRTSPRLTFCLLFSRSFPPCCVSSTRCIDCWYLNRKLSTSTRAATGSGCSGGVTCTLFYPLVRYGWLTSVDVKLYSSPAGSEAASACGPPPPHQAMALCPGDPHQLEHSGRGTPPEIRSGLVPNHSVSRAFDLSEAEHDPHHSGYIVGLFCFVSSGLG